MKILFLISASFLACCLISVTNAHAYLDPGTGSMIIQALLGTIAAVSVTTALFWKRLVCFLGNLFGKSQKEKPPQQ